MTVLEKLQLQRRAWSALATQTANVKKVAIFVGGVGLPIGESKYAKLLEKLRHELPEYDVVDFPYFSTVLSWKHPVKIVKRLGVLVGELVHENQYQHIVLIGHGFGIHLIRQAIEVQKNDASSWIVLLDRLILLSPNNSGDEFTGVSAST